MLILERTKKVYDEINNFLNQNPMKKLTWVIIALYNHEGKIFLQERGDYSKMGEEWSFFWGGVEEGESHYDAFLREVKEELALDMRQFETRYIWMDIKYYSEADFEVTRHFYLVKTDMKKEDFTIFEGIWGEYFTIDEAKKLKFPFHMDEELEMLKRNISL